MKEEFKTLAAEWGIPVALGLAVLGCCEVHAYMEGDKPKTELTVEQKAEKAATARRHRMDDIIPVGAFMP